MGCMTSKQAVSVTPTVDHSGDFHDNVVVGYGRSADGNASSRIITLYLSRSGSVMASLNSIRLSGRIIGTVALDGTSLNNNPRYFTIKKKEKQQENVGNSYMSETTEEEDSSLRTLLEALKHNDDTEANSLNNLYTSASSSAQGNYYS
ncbi:hypothetical protein L6452_37153 [Arctium lappa]|uniref:Uncharacterized protein n=1 Tax=Arctium lappa TaxID=4217 RepID=A0ACB8Y2W2_ARCLA|nr:hypothetical protein L6452_37153 [Arctium lappa]